MALSDTDAKRVLFEPNDHAQLSAIKAGTRFRSHSAVVRAMIMLLKKSGESDVDFGVRIARMMKESCAE